MPANTAALQSYSRLLLQKAELTAELLLLLLLLLIPDMSHRKFAKPLPIDRPRRHPANTFNVDFRWANASRIQKASTVYCTVIDRICMYVYSYVCTHTHVHTRAHARTHTRTTHGQCQDDRRQHDCMALSHAAYANGNPTLQINHLSSDILPFSPHSPLSLPCLQTKTTSSSRNVRNEAGVAAGFPPTAGESCITLACVSPLPRSIAGAAVRCAVRCAVRGTGRGAVGGLERLNCVSCAGVEGGCAVHRNADLAASSSSSSESLKIPDCLVCGICPLTLEEKPAFVGSTVLGVGAGVWAALKTLEACGVCA